MQGRHTSVAELMEIEDDGPDGINAMLMSSISDEIDSVHGRAHSSTNTHGNTRATHGNFAARRCSTESLTMPCAAPAGAGVGLRQPAHRLAARQLH